MIKICTITKEEMLHIESSTTTKTKSQRFNKILKKNNLNSIYDILDNIQDFKKCVFCGKTSAISKYDMLYKDGYLYITNIEYSSKLLFCGPRPDSNKDNCRGKYLNNNSIEFVRYAYNFDNDEDAREYLLKRNKSPFYKHNHKSEEDYKKAQTRDKEWFIKNDKSRDEYCERQAYTNTLEYFVELYGEIEGTKFYFDLNKRKDSSSLKHFVDIYGEELGQQKFYEKCQKCENMSINYYIRKYGEVEGTNKYNYLRSLDGYIEKYGEYKGTRLYTYRYVNIERTSASKESLINLFDKLINKLQELYPDLKYKIGAYGNKEFSMLINGKRFFYDFTIPDLKLIVEYHGSRYHYNENKDYTKLSTLQPLEELKLKDELKRDYTKSVGYEYIEVFDTDDFEIEINKIINIIKIKKDTNE